MLCTMDIGNTCCKVSLYDGREKKKYLRLYTHDTDLQASLSEFLTAHREVIKEVLASCVVPDVWDVLNKLIQNTLHITPHAINQHDDLGIGLRTPHPEEIGSDLMTMAAYAYSQTQKATLLLSFGTATAFAYVDKNGNFLYAIIAPGYKAFENILWNKTALLTQSPLSYQTSVLANNTHDAVSVGVVNGYIGMIRNLIQEFTGSLDDKEVVIWACGGQGKKLIAHLPEIVRYEADLVSDGLAYLYTRRKR